MFSKDNDGNKENDSSGDWLCISSVSVINEAAKFLLLLPIE